MAKGIRDTVALLGMGCAKFGERWDKDEDQLMVEAFEEALDDAGLATSQIDAAWLGAAFDAQKIGPSGLPLAVALQLPATGVTTVENSCAVGTDSVGGSVSEVTSR